MAHRSIVIRIHKSRWRHLLEIAFTNCLLRFALGRSQLRQQHGGENVNDDQKFNQSEC